MEELLTCSEIFKKGKNFLKNLRSVIMFQKLSHAISDSAVLQVSRSSGAWQGHTVNHHHTRRRYRTVQLRPLLPVTPQHGAQTQEVKHSCGHR